MGQGKRWILLVGIAIVVTVVIFLVAGWIYYERAPVATPEQMSEISDGLYQPISSSSVPIATSTVGQGTPEDCGVISEFPDKYGGPTSAAEAEDATSTQNSACMAKALVDCTPAIVTFREVASSSYSASDYQIVDKNSDGTCSIKSRMDRTSATTGFSDAMFQPMLCSKLPPSFLSGNWYLNNEPSLGVLEVFEGLDAARLSVNILNEPVSSSSFAVKYDCNQSNW